MAVAYVALHVVFLSEHFSAFRALGGGLAQLLVVGILGVVALVTVVDVIGAAVGDLAGSCCRWISVSWISASCHKKDSPLALCFM